MEQQLAWAHSYGIGFFMFDWYYRPDVGSHGQGGYINNALERYRAIPDTQGVGYAIWYVNERNYTVPVEEWDHVVDEWATMFQDPQYERIGNKPLFAVLNAPSLLEQFGSVTAVRAAMEKLREAARSRGIPDVFIVAGVYVSAIYPNPAKFPDLSSLRGQGYDAVSQYNYPELPGVVNGRKPLSELALAAQWQWDQFAQASPLPYIPAVMSGWDPRPWDGPRWEGNLMWYSRSPGGVTDFLQNAGDWANAHPRSLPAPDMKAPIVFLEAWNEIGEGSHVLPTRGEGDAYGHAVAKAVFRPPLKAKTFVRVAPLVEEGTRIGVRGALVDANGAGIGDTPVKMQLTVLDGPGIYADYTVTGVAPMNATRFILGYRLNTECSICSGTSEFWLTSMRYTDAGGKTAEVRFTQLPSGWTATPGPAVLEAGETDGQGALHVQVAQGQVGLGQSGAFPLTPGAEYSFTVRARIDSNSLGSGHFVAIFLRDAEVARIRIPLRPAALSLEDVVTRPDGTFSSDFMGAKGNKVGIEVSFGGSITYWPSYARNGP